MGIIYSDIVNIFDGLGIVSPGGRIATFGRLEVFLNKVDISRLRKKYSANGGLISYLRSYRYGEYADRLFSEVFGTSHVDSIDISGYEGATVLCDLSHPIHESLHGQYDLVWDGGTLEHVFNVQVAISNMMCLARPGGMVYVNLPCNNLCGHGFYQFSPELMFRVFSPDNGYEVVFNRIGLAHSPAIETTSGHTLYDVADPDSVRQRVGLMSSRPVYMMVLARRTDVVDLFAKPVVQSDYARGWKHSRNGVAPVVQHDSGRQGVARFCKGMAEVALRAMRAAWEGMKLKKQYAVANRMFYTPVRRNDDS